jgi:hypothetical protein
MKFLKSITSVLVLLVVFSACSKNSDNTPPTTFNGVWQGKFGNDNDAPSVFFSLHFKAGGVLEEIATDGTVKGTGTYTIDNNNVVTGHTVNIKAPIGNKYSYVAAFYPSQAKVLGNWGFGNSGTNGGMFELTIKK